MMNRLPVSKLLSADCGFDSPTIELLLGAAANSKRALAQRRWKRAIPLWCAPVKNFRSNRPRSDVAHGWRSPVESMCLSSSEVAPRIYELDSAELADGH